MIYHSEDELDAGAIEMIEQLERENKRYREVIELMWWNKNYPKIIDEIFKKMERDSE